MRPIYRLLPVAFVLSFASFPALAADQIIYLTADHMVDVVAGAGLGLAGDRLDLRVNGINARPNSDLAIYKSGFTRLQTGNISNFNPVYSIRGGIGQGITPLPGYLVNSALLAPYPEKSADDK